MEPWVRLIVLSVGGALGVNARYWLGFWMNRWASPGFPWATFTINVTGSFATILSDGSLLTVANIDITVDGMRLEGRGVEPDIAVPFDIRYAHGRDPQMNAAMERLQSMIQRITN